MMDYLCMMTSPAGMASQLVCPVCPVYSLVGHSQVPTPPEDSEDMTFEEQSATAGLRCSGQSQKVDESKESQGAGVASPEGHCAMTIVEIQLCQWRILSLPIEVALAKARWQYQHDMSTCDCDRIDNGLRVM